jgi:hypothetical protein
MSQRPLQTVFHQGRRILVSEYIEKERQALRHAVEIFQTHFAGLEVVLSSLLHTILGNPKSKIPLAIYYSVDSFHARVSMVDEALKEATLEDKDLESLMTEDRWLYLMKCIHKARRMRNALAHGTPQTLVFKDRPHIRYAAPVFDVIRISRTVAKRQIPGLTTSDIESGWKPLPLLNTCVNEVNVVVDECRISASRDIYRALDEQLTKLRGLR